MTHQTSIDELPGLSRALAQMSPLTQAAARSEFRRGILEEGFADFSGPERVWLYGRRDGPLKRAQRLVMRSPNFLFELIFVPVSHFGQHPFVQRAQPVSAYANDPLS